MSLRKDEIYAIAEKYKSSQYYEIKQLLNNNKILAKDDSPIDCILNGDSITIVEFLDDCDLSYYDSLILKHKNSQIINVEFNTISGFMKVLHLPIDITGFEMKKSFLCKMEIPFKYMDNFTFIYNSKKIDDNKILKNIFLAESSIYKVVIFDEINLSPRIRLITEGKKIKASIYLNDSNNKAFFSLFIGTLNQIKELYKEIKFSFNTTGKGKIFPGEFELKENDERTFSEIGIRNDFICRWGIKIKLIK